MNSPFREFDTVRVVRLLGAGRGMFPSATREPRVGDVGTIVDISEARGRVSHIVEEGESGLTPAWIAEFDAAELELLHRPGAASSEIPA